MKILIRREAANGDVLMAAAVAPALLKKYPGSTVDFITKCPNVLYGNIYLQAIYTDESQLQQYDKEIDLDLAYERKPQDNILQSYADVAEVSRQDCEPYIYCRQVNMPLFTKYVVVHAGLTNWVGRDWHHDRWKEVALRVHNAGYQIVCVGSGGDKFVPSDADVRNKANLNEVATIIKGAKLFIGIDSMPFHIAQCVNTPGIVFFGCVNPASRIIRDNIDAVVAQNLPCLGCHHRKPAPSTVTNICETGTLDCEHLVTVDQMFDKINDRLSRFNLL